MDNSDVARLLNRIADALSALDENPFKIRAYRNAAQTIETFDEDIRTVRRENRLDAVPGIGKALCEKIAELLDTGSSGYYLDLKKRLPDEFERLVQVESLGPKKVYALYKKLGIQTLKDLEDAALAGKIRKIPGFGGKSEQNILQGLEQVPSTDRRTPYAEAKKAADLAKAWLKKAAPVSRIEAAGSLRRKKNTIGDIDILAISNEPKKVTAAFIRMPDVVSVLGKGEKKASIRLKSGLQVDLRVVSENQWGAALLYFTGSKAHNIELRKIAQGKGWKLNEYGLFDALGRILAQKTEKEIYRALGREYLPPEKREEKK